MNFYKCCLALTQIAFTQITLLVERQDGVLVQTCPYTKNLRCQEPMEYSYLKSQSLITSESYSTLGSPCLPRCCISLRKQGKISRFGQ